MPPEGAIEAATTFLNKARDDLAVFRRLMPGGAEVEDAIGFHAQQSVEKAIKAVMAYRGIRLTRTHDLKKLDEACAAGGVKVPTLKTPAARLTSYAVDARYFDRKKEEPGPLSREDLLSDLEKVLAWAAEEITR